MEKHRLAQKRELMNLVRAFFDDREFFELETPLLVNSPGMEVHLHSFVTQYVHHDGSVSSFHLPTSPEFALKKALGAGFEKVYEIARVFRNQGELGPQHHPEFNMLEWYRPGNYEDIMNDAEELLQHLSSSFSGTHEQSDYSWSTTRRTSIADCFRVHADLDLHKGLQDHTYWKGAASKTLQESIPADDHFEDIFFRVWLKMIEPNLGIEQPEIVFDYPASMAALSKLKAPDLIWSERFELYIKGVEIGNAFSELTDSQEQLRRFNSANLERKALGFSQHPVDQDFIESVGKMKPTGGIAVGLERLLMVLTGVRDIREFFLYPVGGVKRTKNSIEDREPKLPNTTKPF